ncbi:hypothetical protein J2R76_002779 [Bradyrhizobium sp. USDA 4532]|nr:hypothetical protein [Bradyrhizobium sp. USDA 4545]MCP1908277.1 hypothetical protein [Bradyrhizobium elkanii]MCP1919188.1 hypothetical protein [Bradyrhizobium sp. USDA 4532]
MDDGNEAVRQSFGLTRTMLLTSLSASLPPGAFSFLSSGTLLRLRHAPDLSSAQFDRTPGSQPTKR